MILAQGEQLPVQRERTDWMPLQVGKPVPFLGQHYGIGTVDRIEEGNLIPVQHGLRPFQ